MAATPMVTKDDCLTDRLGCQLEIHRILLRGVRQYRDNLEGPGGDFLYKVGQGRSVYHSRSIVPNCARSAWGRLRLAPLWPERPSI